MKENVKRFIAIMTFVLILLGTTGCATVESFYTPECDVPRLDELPEVTRKDLAALDDETYWRVQERETVIVDWALDLEDRVMVLCK